jgi:predicted ribonuclease toxin of YeeF-YezG toxin-antitoxin module
MAKYKVKGTDILYNGKLFAEGNTINLEEKEAKQLADYLELIPESKKESKETKKQDDSKQNKPSKEPENSDGTNVITPATQEGEQ